MNLKARNVILSVLSALILVWGASLLLAQNMIIGAVALAVITIVAAAAMSWAARRPQKPVDNTDGISLSGLFIGAAGAFGIVHFILREETVNLAIPLATVLAGVAGLVSVVAVTKASVRRQAEKDAA